MEKCVGKNEQVFKLFLVVKSVCYLLQILSAMLIFSTLYCFRWKGVQESHLFLNFASFVSEIFTASCFKQLWPITLCKINISFFLLLHFVIGQACQTIEMALHLRKGGDWWTKIRYWSWYENEINTEQTLERS